MILPSSPLGFPDSCPLPIAAQALTNTHSAAIAFIPEPPYQGSGKEYGPLSDKLLGNPGGLQHFLAFREGLALQCLVALAGSDPMLFRTTTQARVTCIRSSTA